MDPTDRPDSAPPGGLNGAAIHGVPDQRHHHQPKALAEALRNTSSSLNGPGPGSETPSEEDYDDTEGIRHRKTTLTRSATTGDKKRPSPNIIRTDSGVQILPEDDQAVQDILQRSSQRAKNPEAAQRASRFSRLVFTNQFSAFDRNNTAAANSPFHGFYTLFWLAVALFVVKISAENWRKYGNILGSNEIMKTMFHRDVVVLLLSDGIMCALTGVSWLLQRLVLSGYLNWDGAGWIVQNIWQSMFIAGVISWTLIRDWPWTHTVFFVLHGLVMLMKQHSYAFYNGYLSTIHAKRTSLLTKLKQLDRAAPSSAASASAAPSSAVPPTSTISTSHLDAPPSAMQRRQSLSRVPTTAESDIDRVARAIASREPLDNEQIHLFERVVKWEIDALADELKGTSADPERAYPNNLTFVDHYKWIPLPTVVYELWYPRSESISWPYVAEKLGAMVGVMFVMIQLSQHSIYPVVMKTVAMKEQGMPFDVRIKEFPWMLSDLIFPFMMEYMLVWYLIWETILNILAELTYFADRSFYDAWWNSVSWDQFARDWNRPVHTFLLRHVYHSSISSMKVNKHTATLITFFLSACVHELIMWCLFKKLRGYLLILQMCQLPLVRLSRTKWLKGRQTLGNVIFWIGIFTAPSLLCSLYLIL